MGSKDNIKRFTVDVDSMHNDWSINLENIIYLSKTYLNDKVKEK